MREDYAIATEWGTPKESNRRGVLMRHFRGIEG